MAGDRFPASNCGPVVRDWLTLLLLLVVLGAHPVDQDKECIGTGERVIYAVAITAWTGFVMAGYLIPLNWTGFGGQTLWSWLNLLVLPAAITTVMALTSTRARRPDACLRPPLSRKTIIAVLATGWIVTVIGGYALRWRWTGYPGHTLWDQLGRLPTAWSGPPPRLCSHGSRAMRPGDASYGIPSGHGPDDNPRGQNMAMRTHSPEDAAKAQGLTVTTTAVPSHQPQDRTPIPWPGRHPEDGAWATCDYAGSCTTLDYITSRRRLQAA